MRYIVKTLGCKANLSDSQLIEVELQKRGWQPIADTKSDSADLCIVNSCTVTDEADRQSRKLASRLFRENPKARVVVTGCAAEVDPERLSRSNGIHYVIGNQNKPKLVELILEELKKETKADEGVILGTVESYSEMLSRHPMDREWPAVGETFELPAETRNRTRSFLKIQEGCNAFCTYCIIPYGRGPSRSLPEREVIRQIQRLADSGIREVVLTGTNIGDYGHEGSLTDLVRGILKETSLERLRVSSLDPMEITHELYGLMELMESDSRLCPHFHVSLQSVDDSVLKLMKRKYGQKEVIRCLNQIVGLKPKGISGGAFVGMDIITGFPGESDSVFEESLKVLKDLPWHRLHVFPYSERAGTPATRLPQLMNVKQSVRLDRARELNELSLNRLTGYYRSLMRTPQLNLNRVLFERGASGRLGKDGWAAGYTPNYLRVLVKASGLFNQIRDVRISDLHIDAVSLDVAFSGEISA